MELGNTLIHNLMICAAAWVVYNLPFQPFRLVHDRIRRFLARRRLRWIATNITKPLAVALIIVWVGLLAFSMVTIHQGAFKIQVSQSLGAPKPTQIDVGLAGNLWASDHWGPIRTKVELTQLDSGAVKQTAKDGDVKRITGTPPNWTAIAGTVFGGTLAAILLAFVLFSANDWWSGRRREVKLRFGYVLAVTLLLFGPAVATFRAGAFQTALSAPGSRDGLLAEIPANSLDQLKTTNDKIGALWKDNFQPRLEGALLAYQSVNPAQPGDIVLLHSSDIHDLPWGIDFEAAVAKSFNVDAILDTGDAASFGNAEENTTIPARIRQNLRKDATDPTLSIPYLYVRGNHDTADFAAAMAASGATVLDGGAPVDVKGLKVYGLADPACSVCAPMTEAQISDVNLTANQRIAADVHQYQPDIVMVHASTMAIEAVGSVPLIEAGHTHIDDAYQQKGTWVLTAGTTGAGGFKACDVQNGNYPAMSLQVQTLRPGATLQVVSYMQVELVPCDPDHLGSMNFPNTILSPATGTNPLAFGQNAAAFEPSTTYYCSLA